MRRNSLVISVILVTAAVIGILSYEYPPTQPIVLLMLGNQVLLVLLGAVVGGLATWPIQRRALMFQHRKEIIERVYAPLFDELTAGRRKLRDSLEAIDHTEWDRIHEKHLSHWMTPKLDKLLTETYRLGGQIVSSASSAQRVVTSVLDNYFFAIWTWRETRITIPTSSGDWTGEYYQSTPFQNLIGPRLFRSIVLGETVPDEPTLQGAYEQLRPYINPEVTGIPVIVEEVRRTLQGDSKVKEFNSLFKTSSEKMDNALKLLKGQLNP